MNDAIAHTAVTVDRTGKKGIARFAPVVARILLGFVFLMTGLNGFLSFLPPPPPDAMPAGAMDLMMAMMKSGYMMPLVAGTQLVGGVLLLANRFVPLALTILAPVIVHILAFHAFLAPGGSAMGVIVLGLEIYLAVVNARAFRPMLAMRS